MSNCRTRLLISYLLNLIMIVLFISSIIWEIVDIINNPDSVYQSVWGLFRYFTIDGNLISCIFNIIISIKQYQALRMKTDEAIQEKTISHFLYMISLISATIDIIIFVVVIFIFVPMADTEMIIGLIGTYKASSVHITVPLILTFRFLFLDKRKRDPKIIEKFYGGIPMVLYGSIMFILCGTKVFKSFDKKEGDGYIPYPFLDIYHQEWYFCTFIALFIFIFGFGISFLFDFLNKKFEKLLLSYDSEETEENEGEEKKLFEESLRE